MADDAGAVQAVGVRRVVALVPLVALVVWELVAKVDERVPTPSSLIRRSPRWQPAVRHFLDPCSRCPHRGATEAATWRARWEELASSGERHMWREHGELP